MSVTESARPREDIARSPSPRRHPVREGLRATMYLARREIRNVLRTPAAFLPSIMMPLFFYFIQSASLSKFASGSGIHNYQAFVLPVSVLFSMSNEGAGLNMVTDIERGYFDKLLLTPVSRMSLVIGAMGANFARIVFTGSLVTFVAMATGLTFKTGVIGAIPMVLLASLWGIAFAAIGMAVALRTGNPQATQGAAVMVFPLLFLTTSFAPLEALSGWLRVAVQFNPITYVLAGLRAFSQTGVNIHDVGLALIAVGFVAALTLPFAFVSLKHRAH